MDIEERVARLERLIDVKTEVIKAKQFQVIGDNGHVIAAMGTNSEGHGIVEIQNAEGEVVASISAGIKGDGLVGIRNAEGKPLVVMGADNRGDGRVVISNAEGKAFRPIRP